VVGKPGDPHPMEVCMSSKMNVMLIAILAVLGGIISLAVRGPKPAGATSMTMTPSVATNPPAIRIQLQTLPPIQQTTPAPTPAPIPATDEQAQPIAAAATVDTAKAVKPDSDRVLKYTAKPGDSVSALAAGLLGADSKTNRDAIIGENKSLQNDPDRVISGKTYKIPTSNGLSAASVARPTTQPDADQLVQIGSNRELRYTARTGDSVSKLAEILLGSDTQVNRDAIINNNASLKSDPDRVVAGQTYWIPAPTPAEKP
jgi:hypothetical protein